MHVTAEVVAFMHRGGRGSRDSDANKEPRRGFKTPCLFPMRYTKPVVPLWRRSQLSDL